MLVSVVIKRYQIGQLLGQNVIKGTHIQVAYCSND